VLTAQVSAGVVREDKGDSDWEFILTPYLWAINLSGASQVGPFPPMDVDASFSDIFRNLNMALAAHMELHRVLPMKIRWMYNQIGVAVAWLSKGGSVFDLHRMT